MSGNVNESLELPTPELREAAFRLFGETDETRRTKLAELREIVTKLPLIGLVDTNDRFLLKYLRGKAFNVGEAAKAIENWTIFKKKHPEWVNHLTPQEFRAFRSVVHFLKARDKEGRVLVLWYIKNFIRVFTQEYIENNPLAFTRFTLYASFLVAENLEVQVHGMLVVPVFSGFTLKNARTYTSISNFHERLEFNQYQLTCTPLRPHGFYIFEEPRYIRWYWSMASSFIMSPVKHNVHICGKKYEMLWPLVDDVKLLPVCLGGQQKLGGTTESRLIPSLDNGIGSGSDEEERTLNTNVFRARKVVLKNNKVTPDLTDDLEEW